MPNMTAEQKSRFQSALKIESEKRARESARNRLVDVSAMLAAAMVANGPLTFEAIARDAVSLALDLEREAERVLKARAGGYANAKPETT
jgi:hypothetical protein